MGRKQRLRAEAQRLREINIGWRQTAAEQSRVNRLLLGEIERLREVAASAASLVRIAGDEHGATFVESRIIPWAPPANKDTPQ